MSKFLLNLLLQISKAILNSKIQFLIQRSFFLAFGPADLAAHSAFGPAGSRWPLLSRRPKPIGRPKPLGPRASLAYLQKYVFFFDSRLPSSAPSLSPLADAWTPLVRFFFSTALPRPRPCHRHTTAPRSAPRDATEPLPPPSLPPLIPPSNRALTKLNGLNHHSPPPLLRPPLRPPRSL
jgi:hypothetical protein